VLHSTPTTAKKLCSARLFIFAGKNGDFFGISPTAAKIFYQIFKEKSIFLIYNKCNMSSITITYLYGLLSEKLGKELATKEDLERGFKEQSRWMLGVFVTLAIMILGLYATILLKK
jgi:hypothetical protein